MSAQQPGGTSVGSGSDPLLFDAALHGTSDTVIRVPAHGAAGAPVAQAAAVVSVGSGMADGMASSSMFGQVPAAATDAAIAPADGAPTKGPHLDPSASAGDPVMSASVLARAIMPEGSTAFRSSNVPIPAEALHPSSMNDAHASTSGSSERPHVDASAERALSALFPRASDAARPLPPPDAVAGIVLGHFTLERRIGTGGMGAVFLAHDNALTRPVALKVLSPSLAAEPSSVQRFTNEARAGARLDHDAIARVFFTGVDRGLHFIAFEYVPGTNLRDVIRMKGRLEPGEAVNYTMQLATALAHMSALGVVHRDIKPSNIIITPTGRAKLVDLGLARRPLSDTSAELTVAGTTLGTFDYISPEQAKDPRLVDVRSDIYSLGCTLYHMLAGEAPYPEGTLLQKLLDHQADQSPDPALKNRQVPAALSALVRKMMATDPRRRHSSAEELLKELMTIATSLGVQSLPVESWLLAGLRSSRPSFLQQNLSWMATTAALLLIVLGMQFFPGWFEPLTGASRPNSSNALVAGAGAANAGAVRTNASRPFPDTSPAPSGHTPPYRTTNGAAPGNQVQVADLGQAAPGRSSVTTGAEAVAGTTSRSSNEPNSTTTSGSAPGQRAASAEGTAAPFPIDDDPAFPVASVPRAMGGSARAAAGGNNVTTNPGTGERLVTSPTNSDPSAVAATDIANRIIGTPAGPVTSRPGLFDSESLPFMTPLLEELILKGSKSASNGGASTGRASSPDPATRPSPGSPTSTPGLVASTDPRLVRDVPGERLVDARPAERVETRSTNEAATSRAVDASTSLPGDASIANVGPEASGTSTASADSGRAANGVSLTETSSTPTALADAGTRSPLASPETIRAATRVSATPFAIAGGGSYRTLEAACAAAKDGAVILLQFDGPGAEVDRPLRLGTKRLTIRADQGFQPTLVFAPTEAPAERASSRMISLTDGALEMVNVGINFRVPDNHAADLWAVFSVERPERLKLERVSVTVQNPRRQPAVVIEQTMPAGASTMDAMTGTPLLEPELLVTNSFIRGSAGFLRVRDSAPLRITLADSVVVLEDSFLTMLGVMNSRPADGGRTRLDLDHVTCLTGGSLISMLANDGFSTELVPLQVSARNNIISCGQQRVLVEVRGETDAMQIGQLLVWTGEKNYYDQVKDFWSVTGGGLGSSIKPLDFVGWSTLWGSSELSSGATARSIWSMAWRQRPMTSLTVQDLVLDRQGSSNPALQGASDGTDLGADLSRLP